MFFFPFAFIVPEIRKHHFSFPITRLYENDTLILSGRNTNELSQIKLYEKEIEKENEWNDKRISDISTEYEFIVLIRRGGKVLIPQGSTKLIENDILVIMDKRNCDLEKLNYL